MAHETIPQAADRGRESRHNPAAVLEDALALTLDRVNLAATSPELERASVADLAGLVARAADLEAELARVIAQQADADAGHARGNDDDERLARQRAERHGFKLLGTGEGYILQTTDPMNLFGIIEHYLDPMDRDARAIDAQAGAGPGTLAEHVAAVERENPTDQQVAAELREQLWETDLIVSAETGEDTYRVSTTRTERGLRAFLAERRYLEAASRVRP